MKQFIKDKDAILDYVWDWSDWLGNDTISDVTVTPSSTDLTIVGDPIELDGVVTAFISGGQTDTSYLVTCKIVTAGLRTDERSGIFTIQER